MLWFSHPVKSHTLTYISRAAELPLCSSLIQGLMTGSRTAMDGMVTFTSDCARAGMQDFKINIILLQCHVSDCDWSLFFSG